MKKLIEAIRKRIRSVIEETQQSRKDAEAAQGKARERKSEAKARQDAAVLAGDMEAYHKARNEESFAQAEENFYVQKLNGLNSPRLVSDEENRDTVARIHAAQQKLHDEALEKIMALTEQVEAVGKAYFVDQDELNDLLQEWHRGIYQQSHPHLNRVMTPDELEFKDSEFRQYIAQCVTAYNYRQNKGLGSYTGTGSIWTR